ncbi:MAG: hypothetical protein Q8O92_14145 [Candidatus Latescibacter sp.]|nr:hypothetical protein [Candidatus Latescibacter sp.]
MRKVGFLIVLCLYSCQFLTCHRKDFSEAQRIVEQIVARHPEIVRLTIHTVPSGEEKNRIIASNIHEKIGKYSDPEDIEVMKTKKIVVLREGSNLDVTALILDKADMAIAAAGVTLTFPGNTTEEALVKKAGEIAQELTAAIRAAKRPLW